MKKHLTTFILSFLLIFATIAIVFLAATRPDDHKITEASELKPLPKPELSEGQRGQLGIDKNVNESTIDDYLARPDSIYIDTRMLEDPATYENIGGNSLLSGIVDGFEVISYPYLATVKDLPAEVGEGYSGPTLFTIDENGDYLPNYTESEKILSDLFPKDKNIFLICGGGGYSGMTKNLLVKKGWDAEKIYVVGGYWYYDGAHKVDLKLNENTYAFYKIPYHNIDFTTLTKI